MSPPNTISTTANGIRSIFRAMNPTRSKANPCFGRITAAKAISFSLILAPYRGEETKEIFFMFTFFLLEKWNNL